MINKPYTLENLDHYVELLYACMSDCSVFTFEGPLGAGKTTLIKKLLARCGVKEVVTSPTFTYVAIYHNDQGQTFYHFDLYRLTSAAEFMELGFDEYLYQPNSYAFIEWPEIIMPLLTHRTCFVSINYLSQTERLLSCKTS